MLGATGRRIGLAALAGAIVLPALVPGVGSGVFTPGGGSGDGGGSGSNSTNVVQPIVSLSQQLHSEETVPLLRVHTSRPEYLRLTALELFDGQRFTLGRLTGQRKDRVEQGLPTPPGTTRTTSVTAQVDVTSNLDEHYLPVPFAPTKVHGASGDWRLSRQTSTIFSVRTDTSGANYQVTSSVPAPTPTELNNQPRAVPADVALDTLLPPTLDPRVRRLARQLAGNASTPYQQVMALLRYLRSDSFTYDINGAPTTTDGALSAFLFTTRRGYCEQFASAMTVMVRALGLPARVAIGFTQGTRQRDGSYLITNKDAHSWPEVYFPTSGWVRFEPTVRTDGGTTDEPSYATPQTTAPDPGAAATQPTPEPSAAAPSTTPQDRLNARDNEPGGTAAQRGGHGSGRSVLWTVAGLVLLVLLTAPAAARLLVRRRRLSRRAGHDATAATHVAWAELVDIATDLKLDLPPSDSPRSSATRLGETLPGGDPGRDALRRLGVAEESARYAPPGSPVPDGSHPGHDVRTAEKSLRASVSLGRRARASLAPPSVLGRVRRTAASGVLDALDSGDRLAGRASSEVSRLLRRGRDGERTTGAGPGGPGSGSGSTEAESEREREKVPS
jgi:transglutaminase-like putative cysteine protease